MILLIDNYDSFTYNLVQYLGEIGATDLQVFRNDKIELDQIAELAPERLIISPGPCTPDVAGISLDLVHRFSGQIPILGVCLGHQTIGQAFGGIVERAPYIMHGKTSEIRHDGQGIYSGLPNPFTATRYHSLIVRRDSVPECLEVVAETDDGLVMGLRHKELSVEGVQFHPESVLTGQKGKKLLSNFVLQTGNQKEMVK
ncbi:MAG TPA: aminodeoxychorismate/anthranilate synthase component II [Candidatus Latescibacteria bacterium]|jgi:anthranilate synthase/aminodeoxychorismate synthase-like glutamine amidotransferase|nr:anthranilate/aminodeoxychorismate synthase component II [Gemmatimonadota bacterium]MDP7362008.1 aminodeoxychorismate/anthranilate synthase component II [Candidatus Latescibacterota bacterium]MBU07977.1 anthranilate/aminodeoxychorismate synthase component II [Gemmatimonadota bacterium]MDP7632601.1 aminodeoxychorismate/anthranilate synthase component II [Candidatus Latescibacterota bacterium]MEE3261818.1 aminodeoxychorismate/anthranilate synthase component II [Candidatus Latescibacterota bacte|tara:strand:- start:21 stop:617 length:597 start_codon:yes stop_codon:yes gene_type:complete